LLPLLTTYICHWLGQVGGEQSRVVEPPGTPSSLRHPLNLNMNKGGGGRKKKKIDIEDLE